MSNRSNKLKAFRKAYNLTQGEAANELGYTKRIWQDYEQDQRMPPNHIIISMEMYTQLHETP